MIMNNDGHDDNTKHNNNNNDNIADNDNNDNFPSFVSLGGLRVYCLPLTDFVLGCCVPDASCDS